MRIYSIEEARKIVMNLAKQYENNLNNKSFIFIYKDFHAKTINYVEVQFCKENYQHLTGIELIDSKGNIRKNVARLFYNKCFHNQLRKDEIRFKTDGTTPLKLMALPILIDIQKVTKITGNYNGTRTYLIADKLIGNVNFCLGLKELDNDFYVPVSALLENIKNLTRNPSQILAVLSKDLSADKYNNIRYVAKGVDLNTVSMPPDLTAIIDLSKYISKNSEANL